MGVRFIIGRAGAGKTHHCLAAVAAACAEQPDGAPLLLLVPEQAAVETARELHARLPATTRAEVLGFRRLGHLLASLGLAEGGGLGPPQPPGPQFDAGGDGIDANAASAGPDGARLPRPPAPPLAKGTVPPGLQAPGTGGLPPLSEAGRRTLIRAVLTGRRSELRVLGRGADRAGTLDALCDTLDEFDHRGCDPAEAADRIAARPAGIQGPDDADFAAAEPVDAGGAGTAGPDRAADVLADLALVRQAMADATRGRFRGPDTLPTLPRNGSLRSVRVWVDGFADFTAGERATLLELLASVGGAEVTLTMDPDDGVLDDPWTEPRPADVDDPFVPGRTEYRRLMRGLRTAGAEVRPALRLRGRPTRRFAGSAVLGRLEAGLSDPTTPPLEPEADGQHGEGPAGGLLPRQDPGSPDGSGHGLNRSAGGAGPALTLLTATGLRGEVEAAADAVAGWISQDRMRQREVGVLVRDLTAYAPLVEEVFTRRGIAHHIDGTAGPTGHPLFRFCRGLLAAAADAGERGTLLAGVLRNPLSGVPAEVADLVDQEARRHRDGGAAWLSGTDGPGAGLAGVRGASSAAELFNHPPGPPFVKGGRDAQAEAGSPPLLTPAPPIVKGGKDAQVEAGSPNSHPPVSPLVKGGRDAAAESVEAARGTAARAVGTLLALWRDGAVPTWAGVLRRLGDVLTAMGVGERLHRLAAEAGRTGDVDGAERDRQAWRLLAGWWTEATRLPDVPVESAGEALALWTAGAAGLTAPRPPATVDVVVVGDVQRTRWAGLRGAVVLGLAEGMFPLPAATDPLLDESARARLQAAGIEVAPGAEGRLPAEAGLLYRALTRASERLVLVRPLRDPQGNPVGPSHALRTVGRLFPWLRERAASATARGTARPAVPRPVTTAAESARPEPVSALMSLPECHPVRVPVEVLDRVMPRVGADNAPPSPPDGGVGNDASDSLVSEASRSSRGAASPGWGNHGPGCGVRRLSLRVLERFADCPFRAWAEEVLLPTPMPAVDPEPAWALLQVRAVERFLARAGADLSTGDPDEDRRRAEALMRQAFDETWAEGAAGADAGPSTPDQAAGLLWSTAGTEVGTDVWEGAEAWPAGPVAGLPVEAWQLVRRTGAALRRGLQAGRLAEVLRRLAPGLATVLRVPGVQVRTAARFGAGPRDVLPAVVVAPRAGADAAPSAGAGAPAGPVPGLRVLLEGRLPRMETAEHAGRSVAAFRFGRAVERVAAVDRWRAGLGLSGAVAALAWLEGAAGPGGSRTTHEAGSPRGPGLAAFAGLPKIVRHDGDGDDDAGHDSGRDRRADGESDSPPHGGSGREGRLRQQGLFVREFLDVLAPDATADGPAGFGLKFNKDGSLSQRAAKGWIREADLDGLLSVVRGHLEELVARMAAGECGVRPWRRGTETACDRCDQRSWCGFRPGVHAWRELV